MDPEMNMRIIYKICPENEDQGKLDQARALWRATVDIQIIYGCRITAPIGKYREIDLTHHSFFCFCNISSIFHWEE